MEQLQMYEPASSRQVPLFSQGFTSHSTYTIKIKCIHCHDAGMYIWSHVLPGSVQICPVYPTPHWHVSLAIQAPFTQDGLQITVKNDLNDNYNTITLIRVDSYKLWKYGHR